MNKPSTEKSKKIYQTKPPRTENIHDEILSEAFTQEIVKQGERFDELTKALFSVELTIPGVYAAIIQLIATKDNPLVIPLLEVTLVCWAVALLITLWSFFPKKYRVMPNVVRRLEKSTASDSLTIEEFYQKSAENKRYYLILSSVIFFAGIIFAGLSVLV